MPLRNVWRYGLLFPHQSSRQLDFLLVFEKAGKQKEVEDVGQQCNKLEDNGEALKEVKNIL